MTTLETKPIALRFSPLSSTPPGVAAAGAAAVAPSMERGAYGMNPGGSIPGFAPVNALMVSAFGGVVLTDANAPIAPGSGCSAARVLAGGMRLGWRGRGR